jgi:hypothetical protein
LKAILRLVDLLLLKKDLKIISEYFQTRKFFSEGCTFEIGEERLGKITCKLNIFGGLISKCLGKFLKLKI